MMRSLLGRVRLSSYLLCLFLLTLCGCAAVADDASTSKPAQGAPKGGKRKSRLADPALIFDYVWRRLARKRGGEDQLTFPKEFIWLNGAPGAGKSTNTKFIQDERTITGEPVVVSSLLSTPEMEKLKAEGLLVDDAEVTLRVFEALMNPKYHEGVVVDGFPRTLPQAHICRMLHDRLLALHKKHQGTELAVSRFTRPIFRIVVLWVDEETSVSRQIARGFAAEEHNAKVLETGVGALEEVRPTDKDDALARKRYKNFTDKTYDALKSLGNLFVFNLINAVDSMEDVKKSIEREMMYQSSIELNPETFKVISQLELASEVTMNARQKLVKRVDAYALNHPEQLKDVVKALREEIYPVIHTHAISGRCSHVSHSEAFLEEYRLQMAIDILTERGFRVSSEPVVRGVKFDIRWVSSAKLGMERSDLTDLAARRGALDASARPSSPSPPRNPSPAISKSPGAAAKHSFEL